MKRVILLAVCTFFLLAGTANAATVLHDNDVLQGGEYGTVIVANHSLGVVIRDCTIRNLITYRSVDLAILDVMVDRASIHGQNVSLQRVTVNKRLTLGGGGPIHVNYLYMSGPLYVNANHVRIEGFVSRLPDESRLSLIQGWGRDVEINTFTTWGGYSLLGRIPRSGWLLWSGFHHGPRMFRHGPNTYPWGYPIGEGVFGPGMGGMDPLP